MAHSKYQTCKIPIPNATNRLSNLSIEILGILGAVLRDGGMEAVHTVLGHIHLFDGTSDSPAKLEEIGLTACEILLTKSCYGNLLSSRFLSKLLYILY